MCRNSNQSDAFFVILVDLHGSVAIRLVVGVGIATIVVRLNVDKDRSSSTQPVNVARQFSFFDGHAAHTMFHGVSMYRDS